MAKHSLLTTLRAAAALPHGELRVLTALTAEPSLTREQIAHAVGVSPAYLSNILPSMLRKNLIVRLVRQTGFNQFLDIFAPHPVLDLESLAAQYVANEATVRATANPDQTGKES